MVGKLFFAFLLAVGNGQSYYGNNQLVNSGQYNPHPQYTLEWESSDQEKNGYTHLHQTRDGDIVRGEYAYELPDNSVFVVRYYVDPVYGYRILHSAKVPGKGKAVVPPPPEGYENPTKNLPIQVPKLPKFERFGY